MFNTIGQIILGIIYGVYLAFFAPVAQRQKAHDWLRQQTTAPTFQKEPMQPKLEISGAKPKPQPQPQTTKLLTEDLWLAGLAPVVTVSSAIQEPRAAIAKASLTPQLFLLPPAQSILEQLAVAVPTSKIKITKPKQAIAKDRSPNTIPAALAQTTVVQLRKLCSERNIKWRNARGSKHLNKAEMIHALTSSKRSRLSLELQCFTTKRDRLRLSPGCAKSRRKAQSL